MPAWGRWPGSAPPGRSARQSTRSRGVAVLLVGGLLVGGLLAAACSGAPDSTSRPADGRTSSTQLNAASAALPVPSGAQRATVDRHVDGDTVILRGQGRGPLPGTPMRVRLLQIDTPEVFGQVECFGPQASARTAELLPVGATVRVQADQRALDRYGRALLLLWDDSGRSIQEILVREGFAGVLHLEPNDLGLAPLQRAEREARAARRGRWGAC